MPRKLTDLTGRKFGSLFVIKTELRTETCGTRKRAFSLCRCVCGKEFWVRNPQLNERSTNKSCGCLRKIFAKNIKPLANHRGIITDLLCQYKRARGRRNGSIKFLLTREEFEILIKSSCYYCGSEPSNLKQSFSRDKNRIIDFMYWNGIDRLDCSKNYENGNVVTCCKNCNYAKGVMNDSDFRTHIKKIYKYLYQNHRRKL